MVKKLGRPTDQRMAVIRNQVSELLWFGRLETTVEKSKSVRVVAEKMLTLAINSFEDEIVTTKSKVNVKGEKIDVQFTNDGPKKLAARRKMMTILRDIQELQGDKESKSAYKERTREINHPLIEKMFREYAPKYSARIKELGIGGGYTRIIKIGSRRGDNADMAVIELI
ncbi:MAG: bL17 family ribosomal protein [Clostridia bacterium]